jgi:hypothetical protein
MAWLENILISIKDNFLGVRFKESTTRWKRDGRESPFFDFEFRGYCVSLSEKTTQLVAAASFVVRWFVENLVCLKGVLIRDV